MTTRANWPDGVRQLPEHRHFLARLPSGDWIEPGFVGNRTAAGADSRPVLEVIDGRITYVNRAAKDLGIIPDFLSGPLAEAWQEPTASEAGASDAPKERLTTNSPLEVSEDAARPAMQPHNDGENAYAELAAIFGEYGFQRCTLPQIAELPPASADAVSMDFAQAASVVEEALHHLTHFARSDFEDVWKAFSRMKHELSMLCQENERLRSAK